MVGGIEQLKHCAGRTKGEQLRVHVVDSIL